MSENQETENVETENVETENVETANAETQNAEAENAEASEVVPAAKNAIEVPAAVFTATLGCNWTRLPDFVTELDARNSRKIVLGLLKTNGIEPSEVEMVKGVQYSGEYAIAFSFQNVKGWDQAGRDADYYACAFVKKELIGQLNYNRLLQYDYFVTPSDNPPASIDCTEIVCDGLLGRLQSLPGFDAARWLIASVKVNGETTLYLKCENLNDVVAEGLRDVLAAPKRNEEQEGDRNEEHKTEGAVEPVEAQGDHTDDSKLSAVAQCGHAAEIDWRVEYEKLKFKYESLQENNEEFSKCNKDWENAYEELERRSKEQIRQNEERSSEKEELSQKVTDLRRANSDLNEQNKTLTGALNKIRSKEASLKSDRLYWMIVIGILAFVMGVCFAFIVALLSKYL